MSSTYLALIEFGTYRVCGAWAAGVSGIIIERPGLFFMQDQWKRSGIRHADIVGRYAGMEGRNCLIYVPTPHTRL